MKLFLNEKLNLFLKKIVKDTPNIINICISVPAFDVRLIINPHVADKYVNCETFTKGLFLLQCILACDEAKMEFKRVWNINKRAINE